MNLGDLGEFGFIERMRAWLPPSMSAVGIGDDAAVIPFGDRSLVASTDALVEGVHFRLDWSSPADIGFKAVSVNVSDLAAMGATPRWLLLALGAPPSTSQEILEPLYRGLVEACALYGTELVGGDTVASDRLMLSLTALGEMDGDPLLRSGAKAGDVVAVTGPLGRAAAGVNLLLSGEVKDVEPAHGLACLEAHRRPVARVNEGSILRRSGAHAALDISDGLASDARRLAEASGVGVELDRLPIAVEAAGVAADRGWDAAQIVLAGGEDLELLVALPREALPVAGVELIEVGHVVDEPGVWLVEEGQRREIGAVGYDHFRTDR